MSNRAYSTSVLLAVLTLLPSAPALAANEIIITHAKALAGNVTPGDAALYPVRIGASGSYVLGSNLTPPAGQIAIQVYASNVSIDLSGYAITGNAKSAWYGIVQAGGRDSLTIKNGTIEEFKFDGILAGGKYAIIDNVRSVENGRHGIDLLGGNYARIVNATAVANLSDGLRCGLSCHLEGNVASDNDGFGILANDASSVLTNTVYRNGATGIGCGGRSCHIESNVVASNGSIGIAADAAGVVGNTVNDNVGVGILATNFASGYGNNRVAGNNGGSPNAQVQGLVAMHPNSCAPACP